MKILKILLLSFIGLVVITAIAAAVAIKVFLPEDKIKTYITDYARTNFNKEVDFDKLSFTFIGIDLKNFRMSEIRTKENTDFVTAEHFTVKISPLPLLYKQIKISNILLQSCEINADKQMIGMSEDRNTGKDDTTTDNVQGTMYDKQQEQQGEDGKEEKNGWDVNIRNLNIKNANVNYKDEQNNIEASIKNFNLSIKDFSFTEPFDCEASCDVDAKQNKLHIALPLNTKMTIYLANFDTDKMLFNVDTFETKYNNASFGLSGKIKNVNNPKIDCSLTAKNIDEKTFKDFVKLNKFNIDKLDFKTKSIVNISSQNANIESLNIVLPNSSSDVSGTIDWSKKDLQYNIKIALDLLTDDFAKFAPDYNLKGKLKTNFVLTQNLIDGNLNLENISSKSEFGNLSNLNLNSSVKIENKIPLQNIDYSKFNIDSVLLNISKCSAKYNDMEFSLNGKIENKTTSALTLTLQAKNITDETAKNFYKCPIKFIIPTLNANSVINFNLKNNTADISKLNIKIPDSSANISGKLNWNNKNNFVYNLNLTLDFLLDNFTKSFPEYNMKGRIKSDAKVSNKDFSGTLNLNNVAFDYLPMAQISKLNLDASAKSKNNITLKTFSGIFNKGNFKGDGSLINNNITFNLNMDKLTIKTSTATATTTATSNKTSQEEKTTSAKTTKQEYYNITTNINIDNINVPYLISKNATLKTSLKSVSADMKKAGGTFDFIMDKGTITDIDKLAENKYAKLFLLIFNALNNNVTSKSNSNGIDYDNMTANVSFTDGLMRTNNVTIKIPLTTMDIKGTVNFKTENVDLKVNTGLYAAMKITGTISNPKTTFDVASTAAQVLGGSKNLEDVGKKLGQSLSNLFK